MRISRIFKTLVIASLCSIASPSFATLIAVDTKIVQLLPREWGMHIIIESTVAQTLPGAGVTCSDSLRPVIPTTKPAFKTMKEAILLAYALKKTIKVYFDTTTSCYGVYPQMYAIDVMTLPGE